MFIPKISVIIPVYNNVEFLDSCINSVVNQHYSNLEIIIIDDGSTDGSENKCDEWKLKDKRITVIHKKNEGVSIARNIGLYFANGDYVAFVDSDDYLDESMYSAMMKTNEKYDCDIVICDLYKVKGKSIEKVTNNIRSGYYDKTTQRSTVFPSLLMTNSVDFPPTISNCVCLFKRKLLHDNNIKYKEHIRFSEDLLFGSQAAYYANSLYYMKDQYYYYYVTNINSVTHSYYENKWENMKKLWIYISDFFLNVHDYNFKKQVDLFLLYIVFNCMNSEKNHQRNNLKKIKQYEKILGDKEVYLMLKRVSPNELSIYWKTKLIIYIYIAESKIIHVLLKRHKNA